MTRWRPIKSAPKDGTHILLAYPSFSDNGETYVGMARWVDCPHEQEISHAIHEHRRDEVPVPPYRPHWETSYVAIRQHCCGMWMRYGYGPESVLIDEPLGWQPLPIPPKLKRS